MKPHKHSELIKAWADGAQIQIYTWIDDIRNINEPSKREWIDDPDPTWNPIYKYRIKPKEKVLRWQWACYVFDQWVIHPRLMSEEEANTVFAGHTYIRTGLDEMECKL